MATDSPAPAARPPRSSARCTICNGRLALEALGRPGRVCECGATRQSIELTQALIATTGRGLQPFLYRMAFEEPVRSAQILDLSGDRALAHVLWVVDGYRTANGTQEVPAGHRPASLSDLAAEAEGSIDLLILRNWLFCAADLDATLDTIAAVVAPGGWAIMQERFAWPFPARTSPSPTPDEPATRPIGGGQTLPEHQVIGADIVDMLAARKMIGEFYRPNHGIDPLFRNAVLLAFKP